MGENMMNSAHKTSTPAYREGWDRIFGVSDASDKRGSTEKYHLMRPMGGGTERVRKVFCGAMVVRDRIVTENNGRFYTRHALGLSEVDGSEVCGNCKRAAKIKE